MDISIEEYVKNQLQNIDVTSLVEAEVRRQVKPLIESETNKFVRDKINELVAQELEKFMAGEVVLKKDWMEEERYSSFSQYIAKMFQQSINQNYHLQRELERMVQNSIKDMYGDMVKRVEAAMLDEVKNNLLK